MNTLIAQLIAPFLDQSSLLNLRLTGHHGLQLFKAALPYVTLWVYLEAPLAVFRGAYGIAIAEESYCSDPRFEDNTLIARKLRTIDWPIGRLWWPMCELEYGLMRLHNIRTLASLDISHTHIGTKDVGEIITNNRHIRVLNLEQCDLIDDSIGPYLALLCLQSLNLSGTRVTPKALDFIGEPASLDISGAPIGRLDGSIRLPHGRQPGPPIDPHRATMAPSYLHIETMGPLSGANVAQLRVNSVDPDAPLYFSGLRFLTKLDTRYTDIGPLCLQQLFENDKPFAFDTARNIYTRRLQYINLAGCVNLTDESLGYLRGVKVVNLNCNKQLSEAGLEALFASNEWDFGPAYGLDISEMQINPRTIRVNGWLKLFNFPNLIDDDLACASEVHTLDIRHCRNITPAALVHLKALRWALVKYASRALKAALEARGVTLLETWPDY